MLKPLDVVPQGFHQVSSESACSTHVACPALRTDRQTDEQSRDLCKLDGLAHLGRESGDAKVQNWIWPTWGEKDLKEEAGRQVTLDPNPLSTGAVIRQKPTSGPSDTMLVDLSPSGTAENSCVSK